MKYWLANSINGLFILLFTYTAVSKFIAFTAFRNVLKAAPVIGKYASWLSAIIPVTELVITAMLFIPFTARKGLIAGVCLLVVFTAYLAFMILTDNNLPCPCGGVIQQLSWRQHIAFNIFFIEAGVAGIYMQNKQMRAPDGV